MDSLAGMGCQFKINLLNFHACGVLLSYTGGALYHVTSRTLVLYNITGCVLLGATFVVDIGHP